MDGAIQQAMCHALLRRIATSPYFID